LELLRFLVVDRYASHVIWQQVRRELNPPESTTERAREGAGEHRLADARHVLEQNVPVAQERDQAQLDDRALPDDHAFDVVGNRGGEFADIPHLDPVSSRAVSWPSRTRQVYWTLKAETITPRA